MEQSEEKSRTIALGNVHKKIADGKWVYWISFRLELQMNARNQYVCVSYDQMNVYFVPWMQQL